MIIACDQSTRKFGIAFGGVDSPAPRTMVLTGLGADDAVFDRMVSGFFETVHSLARMVKAEHCFIEAPLLLNDRAHAAHTAMALIQLTGAIRCAAHRAGCQVHLAAVSTVRKHFIGHGNLPGPAAKLAVLERCRILGWQVQDDNCADAAALWAYGMAVKYPKWSPSSTPLFAARTGAA